MFSVLWPYDNGTLLATYFSSLLSVDILQKKCPDVIEKYQADIARAKGYFVQENRESEPGIIICLIDLISLKKISIMGHALNVTLWCRRPNETPLCGMSGLALDIKKFWTIL